MRIIKGSEIDAMPLEDRSAAHWANAVEHGRRAEIAFRLAIATAVLAIILAIVGAVVSR